jgi:hypothetical protein
MACLGSNEPIRELDPYSKVYFDYLESILDLIPPGLLSVMPTPPSLTERSPEGLTRRLYIILQVLGQLLSDEQNHVLLRTACTRLEDLDLVLGEAYDVANHESSNTKPPSPVEATVPEAITGNQTKTAQLVFILLGLLTMFYDPTPNPQEGLLQIRRTGRDLKASRRSTATWEIDSQDLSELGRDISFDDLLCRYSQHPGPVPTPRVPQQQSNPDAGILRSQDVSFYTLANLLSVEIVWTTSICEHLEFSVRTKQLKLFRFPSFCVLLCLLEPDRTFLDG